MKIDGANKIKICDDMAGSITVMIPTITLFIKLQQMDHQEQAYVHANALI
jgi:hypothetical protein